MIRRWAEYFKTIAYSAAKGSKDASTQVGAILVRPDHSVASTGFNGFPARLHDNPLLLDAKTDKQRMLKYDRMVHAEANCLDYCRDNDLTGYTMIVTHHPCKACALRIASTGIAMVYYIEPLKEHWNESVTVAREILEEAGIGVYEL